MVDYNLIAELDSEGSSIDAEVAALFDKSGGDDPLAELVGEQNDDFMPGSILTGHIVGRAGDDFVVDVGLKSEGLIPVGEWDDISSVDPGDEVQVWLETFESDSGHIVLSKRKADRILNWHRIIDTKNEGDNVEGRVMRKIKGGLLVDIGYPVFLPASQVDIRRPGDIGEFIGKTIEAKILKIDTERRNIVISRRRLIEEKRATAKEALMAELEVGQVRRGVVKNIADFGAFADLGGIDGLLHITDLSWDRVGHPSEVVKIDEEIEVKILSIDRAKEKIALGLKQLTPNPWDQVEERYPPDTRLNGEVVNIVNYGAFVKIEPGVEGLVHISEMSWTRRINHPSEVLAVGDVVEAIVLDVNRGKQEISLGIKQTLPNPWEHVAEKYPPNTKIHGLVRNLTNYGAFVEIEEGIDGLLHVSDLSWTKKINHPSEVLKKGDEIDCVVLKVEQGKQRIALGLKQLQEDPWARAVPENYIPGQIVEGSVTKITNFGVFVELEEHLEGLLHVSELADHKVEDPHSEVKIGDKILVKILRVDPSERKIGLSKKRAEWSMDKDDEAAVAEVAKVRRGGLEPTAGLLTLPLDETAEGEEGRDKPDETSADGDAGGDQGAGGEARQATAEDTSVGGDPTGKLDVGADETETVKNEKAPVEPVDQGAESETQPEEKAEESDPVA